MKKEQALKHLALRPEDIALITFALRRFSRQASVGDLQDDAYKLIAEIEVNSKEKSDVPEFPNGFNFWIETFMDVVWFIRNEMSSVSEEADNNLVHRTYNQGGFRDLRSLALEWTNEFENEHKGVKWGEDNDGLDWQETIDAWLSKKNNFVKQINPES